MKWRHGPGLVVVWGVSALSGFAGLAWGQEVGEAKDDSVETIVVYGRALDLIGSATAASEGIVGYADFEDRPLSRIGELVEVIPGAIATQHSGEGKANQYFLRGFNLDHGTDFAVSVDGLPVNMRTHGHGQGYLDLNFLIPEIVEQVRYRKGPYFADGGDFSSAGSASFRTYDRLPENFAEVRIGEYGYVRGLSAGSVELGEETSLLAAAEIQAYDGPWSLEQDLSKINAMAKLSGRSERISYDLALWAYDSEWKSSDQIPLRAAQSGMIDRFGNIDDDLGGETSRYALTGGLAMDHADGSSSEVRAYALTYDFSLFSNFTYFLEDPVNGDEFEQRDQRTVVGGSFVHERVASERIDLRFGADVRRDAIDEIGLYRTAARERLATVRNDEVEETSAALWGEAEVHLSETVRASVGLRGDYYDAEVTAISEPLNGGQADDALLSPSAGLAWRAAPDVEFYANYGRGFHSNDVRGATISIDPSSGDPAQRVPILVVSDGAELGARIERERWNASLAAFWLELESELVFVGDGGSTEANDASERFGVEASGFWQPLGWLTLDGAVAWTDARFDIAGAANRIPGAVESVVSGGAVARLDLVTLSLRVRHFSDAPLIEDGSVSSEPTTLVNAAATWDVGRATLGVEVLNLFDSKDADITYFYESQLAAEASPVEDFHFHPVEPRQIRGSIRYRF